MTAIQATQPFTLPFLLDPDHEHVLTAKRKSADCRPGLKGFLRLLRKRISPFWLWTVWVGLLLTLVVVSQWRSGQLKPPSDWTLAVGLWNVGVVAWLGWQLAGIRQAWRLYRTGRLLPGKMLEFRITPAGRRGAVQAAIRYHFQRPDGRGQFERTWAWVAPKFMLQQPPPGTPLAVLYLDEQNHMVL